MLRCEKCGAQSKTADHWTVLLTDADEGWAAYLTVDDDVAVYCSSCAKREFGEPARATE